MARGGSRGPRYAQARARIPADLCHRRHRRGRSGGLESIAPVASSTTAMRDRNDNSLAIDERGDDRVGEAAQNESSNIVLSRNSRDVAPTTWEVRGARHGASYLGCEQSAVLLTFALIPDDGVLELDGGVDLEREPHQPRPSARRIRASTSSPGMSLDSPRDTAAMRREISAVHSGLSSSCASRRLSVSASIKSARWGSGSARACAKTFFASAVTKLKSTPSYSPRPCATWALSRRCSRAPAARGGPRSTASRPRRPVDPPATGGAASRASAPACCCQRADPEPPAPHC